MKNYEHLKRFACVLIVLALLVGMSACEDSGRRRRSRRKTTATTQTTQPTQPTVYPDDQEPESYELKFTLTQTDVDEFYHLLEECESVVLSNAAADTIKDAVEAMEDAYDYLYFQRNTAMVLHYSKTKDRTLEQQYLDSADIVSSAYDAYLKMCRRLYVCDNAGKEVFFEDWTQADIDEMLSYDQRASQLQQRNVEIGVEYRAADSDREKIDLYIELVQNNNAIAQIFGYANYYEYAYEMVYDRDYDQNAVDTLRQYAKDYLVDIFLEAEEGFYSSINKLSSSGIDNVQSFLFDNYDALNKDYVGAYIEAAPSNLAAAMQTMLDRDSMFAYFSDSDEGAFTIDLGNRPFCYYGPGYASCNTILHEGGHYYAALYTPMNDIPLDLAEVHSQANEWLFIQFVEGEMAKKEHQAVVDYMLYDNISMLLVCLMVDEFEQRVYTSDVSGFTAEDFDAIMDQVKSKYALGSSVGDMNYYWRMVVVEQPVYYISYAVSGIAAMSLFTVAQDDWDEAMEIYQDLCEGFDENAGFLGNLQDTGLYTPFDEQFYVALRVLVDG